MASGAPGENDNVFAYSELYRVGLLGRSVALQATETGSIPVHDTNNAAIVYWLGRCPFKAESGVQFPVAVPSLMDVCAERRRQLTVNQ